MSTFDESSASYKAARVITVVAGSNNTLPWKVGNMTSLGRITEIKRALLMCRKSDDPFDFGLWRRVDVVVARSFGDPVLESWTPIDQVKPEER